MKTDINYKIDINYSHYVDNTRRQKECVETKYSGPSDTHSEYVRRHLRNDIKILSKNKTDFILGEIVIYELHPIIVMEERKILNIKL